MNFLVVIFTVCIFYAVRSEEDGRDNQLDQLTEVLDLISMKFIYVGELNNRVHSVDRQLYVAGSRVGIGKHLNVLDNDGKTRNVIKKRAVSATATPNCLYSWTFQRLNVSRDQNNVIVRIAQTVHEQHFQVIHCLQASNSPSCGGMDNSRYDTQCRVTKALHYAHLCNTMFDCVNASRPGYIYVDSGCACYVKQKAGTPSK